MTVAFDIVLRLDDDYHSAEDHLESFIQGYAERFERSYGFFLPVSGRSSSPRGADGRHDTTSDIRAASGRVGYLKCDRLGGKITPPHPYPPFYPTGEPLG